MTARTPLLAQDTLLEIDQSMLDRRTAINQPGARRLRLSAFGLGVGMAWGISAFVLFTVTDTGRLLDVLQGRPLVGMLLAAIMTTLSVWLHIRVVLGAMTLPSKGVSRQSITEWDTLVLTGISARRLILGKWMTALHHMGPQFVLLAFVRVGAVLATSLFVFGGTQFTISRGAEIVLVADPVAHVLGAALIVALLTLLNALFSTAVGVAGAMFHFGAIPLSEAFVARALMIGTALLAINGIFWLGMVALFPGVLESYALDAYLATSFSLVDNGALAGMMIAAPAESGMPPWLVGTLIVALLLGMMAAFGLFVGWAQAVRKGMLP